MIIHGQRLSKNAEDFIAQYEKKLDRSWRFDSLPYDYSYWGDLDYDDKFYIIRTKKNIPAESFDAVFCHEFYHAFQISRGFPAVRANNDDASDIKLYAERLTTAILDLSADSALSKHMIDNSILIRQRYKQVKELGRGGFSRCDTPFGRDLLVVDLIIDLHGVAAGQKNMVLQDLKKALPGAHEMYVTFMEKIEEHGYSTPEGCFKIFGSILSHVGLWDYCHISYCGNQVHNLQQLRNALEHDKKMESKLESYIAGHHNNLIGVESQELQ